MYDLLQGRRVSKAVIFCRLYTVMSVLLRCLHGICNNIIEGMAEGGFYGW